MTEGATVCDEGWNNGREQTTVEDLMPNTVGPDESLLSTTFQPNPPGLIDPPPPFRAQAPACKFVLWEEGIDVADCFQLSSQAANPPPPSPHLSRPVRPFKNQTKHTNLPSVADTLFAWKHRIGKPTCFLPSS